MKFYWSLIALEIVRGHCTDNHGKLTLLNRKLVWKIADVPLLGFVVKHHFMCFFGRCFDAWFRSAPPKENADFSPPEISSTSWWDQDLSGSAVLESPVAFGGGPDPWENCPRVPLVRLFVPSQPGLRPPKRRTERPSQVEGGKTRQKKHGHFFFPNFLTRLVG